MSLRTRASRPADCECGGGIPGPGRSCSADRVEAGCSFAAGSSVDDGGLDNSAVAVLCGLPPEQVAGLVKLAASPSAGDRMVLLVRLPRDRPPPTAASPVENRRPVSSKSCTNSRSTRRSLPIALPGSRGEHGRLVPEIRVLPAADPEVQGIA